MGVHLGVWGFIPSHSPTFLGAWDVTFGLPSWPSPLQAFALVASFRLRLRHEVKLIICFPNLLLAITYVLNAQMDHESPFQTYKFQELSNDISNSSIEWVLTVAITLWRFGNPLGLQLPKWEFTWTRECGGSFLHIFLHFREHEMWFPGFTLGSHLHNLALVASPRLGLWHATFCTLMNNIF
jgi:hypothetical protein